tara:strand:+ start:403 stop:1128 length:726 start_codon:yes stop_codon:yes gene_type:complete
MTTINSSVPKVKLTEFVVDIFRLVVEMDDSRYILVAHSADGSDIEFALNDPDLSLQLSRDYRICDEHGVDMYITDSQLQDELTALLHEHVDALEKLSRSMSVLRNMINTSPKHWSAIANRLDTKGGRCHDEIYRESIEVFDGELGLKNARVLFPDEYAYIEEELYAIVQAYAPMFDAPKTPPDRAAKCVLDNAKQSAKALNRPIGSMVGQALDRWQEEQDLRLAEREEVEWKVLQLLKDSK